MAQGPSGTILVAIRITLRIREYKVRNPVPPDRRRFVLSERSFLVEQVMCHVVGSYRQGNATAGCLSVCLSVCLFDHVSAPLYGERRANNADKSE